MTCDAGGSRGGGSEAEETIFLRALSRWWVPSSEREWASDASAWILLPRVTLMQMRKKEGYVACRKWEGDMWGHWRKKENIVFYRLDSWVLIFGKWALPSTTVHVKLAKPGRTNMFLWQFWLTLLLSPYLGTLATLWPLHPQHLTGKFAKRETRHANSKLST